MLAEDQVLNKFKECFDADKDKFIKNWIVRWRYVDVVQNKQEFYQLDRLYSFEGKQELTEWLDYCTWHPKTNYFPEEQVRSFIDKSLHKDKEIFSKLGLDFKWSTEDYHKFIGIINAEDYMLQNFYPVPERNKINTVLDFGAGYGRQANLWGQENDQLVYVGMDAIPNSYCTQHMYYAQLGLPFHDYIEERQSFEIDLAKNGIYHLPTWRYDLLPSKSFDLVICSQVLSEINGRLARHMIAQFKRILKPGGALYIRDAGAHMHNKGNKINMDEHVVANGFHLEFRPYIQRGKDLHAFPRIFRKEDPEVEASRFAKSSLLEEINYYSGGHLKKLYRKISGK